jgi:hypothetical protein
LLWFGATAGGPTTSQTSSVDCAWRTIDADARIAASEETWPNVRFSRALDVRFPILFWLD